MLRVYRTWIDGEEKLVKANSKKDVRNTLGVETVEFWCNLTKKNESLLSNIPVCNGNPIKVFYCVATTVFSSGKTVMNIVASQTAEERPANSFKSTNRADYYCDWFDSKEEAEKFIAENN